MPRRGRLPDKKPTAIRLNRGGLFGGPGGIRTLDLCVANAALSQLSYKPVPSHSRIRSNALLLTALL